MNRMKRPCRLNSRGRIGPVLQRAHACGPMCRQCRGARRGIRRPGIAQSRHAASFFLVRRASTVPDVTVPLAQCRRGARGRGRARVAAAHAAPCAVARVQRRATCGCRSSATGIAGATAAMGGASRPSRQRAAPETREAPIPRTDWQLQGADEVRATRKFKYAHIAMFSSALRRLPRMSFILRCITSMARITMSSGRIAPVDSTAKLKSCFFSLTFTRLAYSRA